MAVEKMELMVTDRKESKGMELLVANGNELTKKELVEWRQEVVALGMLARKSVRQIQAELAEKGIGTPCSRGTVGHDMQVVRAKWASVRGAAADELVGEEVARLHELEKRWWAMATGEGVDPTEAAAAADRVMAIIRQRAALLGLGGGGAKPSVQVTAGAMTATGAGGVNTEGPLPAGAQVKVLVEYVDDRRDLGKFSQVR